MRAPLPVVALLGSSLLAACMATPEAVFTELEAGSSSAPPDINVDAGSDALAVPQEDAAPAAPGSGDGATPDGGAAPACASCLDASATADVRSPPPPPPPQVDAGAAEDAAPPTPTCPSQVPPQADVCCGAVPCVGHNCTSHCGECAACAGQVCCAAGGNGDKSDEQGVSCAASPAACGGGPRRRE